MTEQGTKPDGHIPQFESLEPRLLLASSVVISEFMASNHRTLVDQTGAYSDWIEVQNVSSGTVNLAGWHLTKNPTDQSKWWHFPSVDVAPGDYLVVFASGLNTVINGEIHTSFKLGAAGDYLALIEPNHVTKASEFTPEYPPQITDVSYGTRDTVTTNTLVEEHALAKVKIPTAADGPLGLTWTQTGFNDSGWTISGPTGIGFEVLPSPGAGTFYLGPFGPGGTWNLYEVVPDYLTWIDAYNAAQARTQGGKTGHLVTIGSTAENNFVRTIAGGDSWIGLTDSDTFASLGAHEGGNTSGLPLPAAGMPPAEGERGHGFAWVTGEPFTYQNWSSGEPNDYAPGEDAGQIYGNGAWNDNRNGEGSQTGATLRYVVEYEVGLSAIGPAFKVERANSLTSNLPSLSDAIAFLNDNPTVAYASPFINFSEPESPGGGRFGGDIPPPGDTPQADVNYVLRITGTIRVPTAGDWTFNVNTDDGFRLRIPGQTFKSVAGGGTTINGDTLEFAGLRGAGDSLGIISLEAGDYPIELTYFQQFGGASVEFSAAYGSYSSVPSPSPFRLVGDTPSGGLAIPGAGDLVATNVAGDMKGVNASAYIRIPFTVAPGTTFNHLHLDMQYDDGFVAFLDGVEVARASAPTGPLAWDSAAAAPRPGYEVTTAHEFDIYRTLAAGDHVLAIQGLNAGADDTDFLVLPKLDAVTVVSTELRYFTTPSPGWPNGEGIAAIVADTQFSDRRGFYTTPFDLTISTDTVDATIRYTTDGSAPTATTGTVYTAPLTIDRTTILRAAAFKNDYDPANVDTQTYIFVGDVVSQSLNGQPPAGWPTGPVNGQTLDYGMDPDVVNDPRYWDLMDDALLQIPSISIVTNLSNLFDPMTGIYVNAGQDGSGWERPTSVELINPDGTPGFQIDAGLRIRGGYSRSGGNPKHAFRLLFRPEYGAAQLHYPLFGADGVDKFENIDLRTSQNYSWSFDGGNQNVMVRDVFNRDTQLAMGDPSSRSRFYHLYLDGQYWGIYMTEERPEASFAESYFGGNKDDYDVVKVTDGYTIFATDGNLDAYQRLYNAAVVGFESNEAYFRILGQNPDGTRNPAYEIQVDPDNLIDYMLGIYWSGDLDAPLSNFLGNQQPNNLYAIRDRNGQQGWQFIRHDAEHTLLDVNQNRVYGMDGSVSPAKPYFWTGGDQFQYFNPQWLHQKLMENAEYRLRFADRVQEWFYNDGALTAQAALDRFNERANQINTAIIAESARWGDSKTATPRTKDNDWLPEINRIATSFIPQRGNIVLNQFRSTPDPHDPNNPPATLSWLSSVAAPTFNQFGGTIPSQAPWFNLTMTAPAGTIYYTLDGTDPRLIGGAAAPGALVYGGSIPLTRSMRILARAAVDDGSGNLTWSALDDATFVRDTPPALRITEIMYHPPDPPVGSPYVDDDFQYIELQNTGAETLNLSGYRLTDGVDFTFPNIDLAPGQYVLVVANQAAFESRYPAVPVGRIIGQFTGNLAHADERIALDAGLDGILLDFQYKDGWYPHTDGGGFSLVVRDPAQTRLLWDSQDGWRPSRANGGSPAAGDTDYNPDSIVINEILAHQDTEVPGDWIELRNTTAAPIDVSGWFLSDDPADLAKYRIPDGTPPIPAGGYLVLNEFYNFGRAGNAGVQTPFAFSELGETACLTGAAPDGSPGGYRASETFPASDRDVALGRYIKSTGGKDFVAMAAATPGADNSYPAVGLVPRTDGTLADPGIVINEILYAPAAGFDEFIELYNLTDADVPMYDPANSLNTWKFLEGLGSQYALPASATIPAHGYALVVPIDPAAYRTKYGIPAAVPIYGPYSGRLSNDGESVELARPGAPELDGTVPYYRVDRVTYDEAAPWPTRAGTGGSSLVRSLAAHYGNDVANWAAGTTNGTPGATNVPADTTPPTVPTGLVAVVAAPGRIDLSWTASTDPESAVGRYRIWRNGLPIGTSTTTTYSDTAASPAILYSYQVSAVGRDDPESARSAATVARILAVQSVMPVSQTSLQVIFTETVQRASAENLANYTITYPPAGSLTITAASLAADNLTVTLTLSAPMAFDTLYTLTTRNIVALSGYTVAPNSQKTFNYFLKGTGTILREWWTGIGGTAVSNLTGSANYPNNPTGRDERNIFETPINWADNYGTRTRGYVTAPATGSYTFWVSSDDASELWFNPNGENPAGKQKIAWVSGWTNSREWTREGNQKSAVFTLQAGQRYYIEALQKEGGGGDNLAVGWQLPDGTYEQPIPGYRLSPFMPTADITVTIAATDASASEPGTDTALFTVTRTGNLVPAVTVYYTVGGTVSTSDYLALSGWVTIPANQASATIQLVPYDDTEDEPTETAIITLSTGHPAYAVGAEASAQATIADNDLPRVNVVATDPSAAEQGSDPGTITISRVGDLSGSLTIYYTVGGSANSTNDYTVTPAFGSPVTLGPGVASVAYVITPIDDTRIESDETVVVTLSSNASYVKGSSPATVTIVDNDRPVVSILATDPNASETGPDSGTFTISRAGGILSSSLTVYYAVSGTATPTSDYPALSGSVTLGANVTSVPIAITPVNDSLSEPPETVILTLSTNSSYTVGSSNAATVTIADNDLPTVSIAATDPNASETGPDKGTFTVTRVGDLTVPLTARYTVGGTALPADYRETLSGSVAFAVGQSSAVIDVTPVDDNSGEPAETVILTLSADPAYLVGTSSSATVTIADNDPPSVSIRATDPTASEAGTDKGTFTLTRAGDLTAPLTVYYTRGGTATPSSYQQTLSGSLTFAAGAGQATIDITPIDDLIDEPLQTVVLALLPGPAYVFGSPKSDAVSIADNDLPTVSVVATDPDASETGPDTGTITISREGDLSVPLTAHYTVSGTATPTSDYTASPALGSSVVFGVGVASIPILISPVDDATPEPNETVVVTLSSRAQYIVGSASAAVTIADNDQPIDTTAPTVTAIKMNGHDERGPSTIDPSGRGVQTIEVSFSEPVTFAANDVTVQTARVPTSETPTTVAATVTGSGTDTMLITLDAPAVDTWVRITLSGNETLTDLQGLMLDGEAKANGGGAGYIVSASADLPTGDGTPGGDAVFYVGSLRGDYSGDRQVTAADLPLFEAALVAGDLDADLRGTDFGSAAPDGQVTVEDLDAFASIYQRARAGGGTTLGALPLGGGTPAGTVAELPALPALGASLPAAGADLKARDAQAAAGLPSSPEIDLVAAAPAVVTLQTAEPDGNPLGPSSVRKHNRHEPRLDAPRIKHLRHGKGLSHAPQGRP